MNKILVINLGSTSTKVAYYEDHAQRYLESIEHPVSELKKYENFMDQIEYRKQSIEEFIKKNNIDKTQLNAIVSRAGHTEPLPSGVYKINQAMINQQLSGKFGQHPTDMGSSIAYKLAKDLGILALVVDPPVTDEFEEVARLSGHPLLPRKSSFHALNHKATAKRYAKDIAMPYEDLNLIVAHLGGGISIAPHKKGRMVDGDNGLEGDGCFSTNRTGSLPVGQLVDLCFSGDYSYKEIKKMINGEGGLVAYTGTADVRKIEEESVTNDEINLYFEGLIYQVAKQIGAMSTVFKDQTDAILLTGGIAHSQRVVDTIKERCGHIAPIVVYPGENEMNSLALGALKALTDPSNQTINEFKSTVSGF